MIVGVAKQISKNTVVGDAKLTTIILVGNVEGFNPVGKDWKTMSFQKTEFDQFIVCSPIYTCF